MALDNKLLSLFAPIGWFAVEPFSMKHGWDHIQQILESRLNPGLYKVWIKPLSGEVLGDVLELTAPNGFVASWVRDRLFDSIEEAARFALGQDLTVRIRTAPVQPGATAKIPVPMLLPTQSAPQTGGMSATSEQPPVTSSPPRTGKDCNWLFNFDDFIVGPSNQLAHAASMGICQNSLSVDKLFLSSAPGLGKTHLIQAIGNELASQANRTVRARYLTAEEFATCMVVALKMREIERFKTEFREQVDLLLLEDIHFLQGKEKIQAEMLATLKALQSRGSKVVFTSSFLPRELSDVDDQLVSRFSSGFLANIEAPDFETRRRIIEFKATKRFQMNIPHGSVRPAGRTYRQRHPAAGKLSQKPGAQGQAAQPEDHPGHGGTDSGQLRLPRPEARHGADHPLRVRSIFPGPGGTAFQKPQTIYCHGPQHRIFPGPPPHQPLPQGHRTEIQPQTLHRHQGHHQTRA